jgi:hypothetical protein
MKQAWHGGAAVEPSLGGALIAASEHGERRN